VCVVINTPPDRPHIRTRKNERTNFNFAGKWKSEKVRKASFTIIRSRFFARTALYDTYNSCLCL
jgi:hypothetical protein